MPTFPFSLRFRSSLFALSGAFLAFFAESVPTQAQTPIFNVAEYADNTDYAAASFAGDVARRAGAIPQRSSAVGVQIPQNATNTRDATNIQTSFAASPSTPLRSNARSNEAKSQAAQIWESFLFGTPNRSVSTPKFAFSRRADAPNAPSSSVSSRSPRRPNESVPNPTIESVRRVPERPSQPAPSVRSPLQSTQPSTDAEIAAARRRRLRELNALLASRRPEEFSRRAALRTDSFPQSSVSSSVEPANDDLIAANAPALPILCVPRETTPGRPNAVSSERGDLTALDQTARPLQFAQTAEFQRDNAAPFNAARANRSKIRQASSLEPADSTALELADDGFAAFLLPTRPNALRLSPNVFLSTDLVQLPNAASLDDSSEAERAEQPNRSPQPLQSSRSPQSLQPLQTAPSPQNVATPAPELAPLADAPSTGVPTLRPTAKFVEPRFLPSGR